MSFLAHLDSSYINHKTGLHTIHSITNSKHDHQTGYLFSSYAAVVLIVNVVMNILFKVFLLIQFFVTDQSTKDALHYLTLFDPSYA